MNMTRIQCAPPDQPGSMKEYGHLLEQSFSLHVDAGLDVATMAFHDQRACASMWQHHRWRMLHARRLFLAPTNRWYHLLDGSMGAFIPRRLWPQVLVSVHDLIPALIQRGALPGASPSLPARVLIARSLHLLKHCRAIHAVSESTRRDVEQLTGRADATVIPLAVRTLNNAENELDVPQRFILHLGNNAAYKNRRGALEVFERLHDVADLHLIMAGPEPTPALRQQAGKIPRVVFMRDVSDGVLAALYRRAGLLLFPSRYEGFGMPVLEAMAQGCPVVCSNAGSLPEVAGEAALMAPPADVDGLAGHCRRLLLEPALRADFVARGKVRAAGFSLTRMGEQFAAWYKRSTDKLTSAC